MKQLSQMSKSYLPKSEDVMVEFIAVLGGNRKLETPQLSSETKCLVCGFEEGYTCCMDAVAKDTRKLWICGNRDCVTTTAISKSNHQTTQTEGKRAVQWPVWCEFNN